MSSRSYRVGVLGVLALGAAAAVSVLAEGFGASVVLPLAALVAAIAASGGVLRALTSSTVGAPLALRLWLEVWVLGALALAWAGPEYERRFGLWALTILALLSSLLVLATMGIRAPTSRWARGADLVVFNLALLVLVGELGLRGLGRVRPSVLLSQDLSRPVDRIRQSRMEPGKLYLSFPINRDGHYDDEPRPAPPGRTLVLSIGDSFSLGVVPHHYHFTTVAERALAATDVYNMGHPSTAPPEYLHLLLSQGLKLEPDAVVVNVFVGNDLDYWPIGDSPRTLPARLFNRQNWLILQAPRRLILLQDEERKRARRSTAASLPDEPAEIVRDPEALAGIYPWLSDPLLETPRLSEERFLQVERDVAVRLHLQGEAGYRLRFEKIAAMARAAPSGRFLVMIIPDVYQVEDPLWSAICCQDETPLQRNRGHDLLVGWLEERGIAYVDLLPLLRAVPPLSDGWRHLYHRSDTHFNARGNDVAGRALARRLVELGDRFELDEPE